MIAGSSTVSVSERHWLRHTAMTTIQQSLTINATTEVISAYASDPNHLPEWNPIIERVWDVQPTPEVVGTTWKVAVKVLGAEHQVTARINRYEPPGRFGLELVGGVPGLPGIAATLLLEARPATTPRAGVPADQPTPASAQVICTLDIQLPLRLGGAASVKLVSPLISDHLRQSLLALKRALEGQPS
jgi:hypothetical protein